MLAGMAHKHLFPCSWAGRAECTRPSWIEGSTQPCWVIAGWAVPCTCAQPGHSNSSCAYARHATQIYIC